MSEYTGTEVTAFIAWRYVRNKQNEWYIYRLREEFGISHGTVREIFRAIGQVIGVEKTRGYSWWLENAGSCGVYVLSGTPIYSNGSPLGTRAGAFAIAYHLAVNRFEDNAILASMVGWTPKRVRQLIQCRLRYIPLQKVAGHFGTEWHVMN